MSEREHGGKVESPGLRRALRSPLTSVALLCLAGIASACATRSIPTGNGVSQVDLMPVSIPRGSDAIRGILAVPAGRPPPRRSIIVIPGRSLDEAYIADVVRRLAEAGFAAMALDIYSAIPAGASIAEGRRLLAERVTDEVVADDVRWAVAFLEEAGFADAHPAILGFCFGGRAALLHAAMTSGPVRVVSIYGNLRLPAEAGRSTDPWLERGRFDDPILGIYATDDREIPLADAREFFRDLTTRGVPVELVEYEAGHGFFDPARPAYNEHARDAAWERIIRFLSRP